MTEPVDRNNAADRHSIDAHAAIERVQTYLMAMQRRDLASARDCLHAQFSMQFPGSAELHSLSELLDWASQRYRFVQKHVQGQDVAVNGKDIVVYVRGTLSGEWPDGSPFSDIRFIDRVVLRDGLLWRQDVWNDLADARADLP